MKVKALELESIRMHFCDAAFFTLKTESLYSLGRWESVFYTLNPFPAHKSKNIWTSILLDLLEANMELAMGWMKKCFLEEVWS